MEKTLQEFYDELIKNEKLIKEFTEAENEGKVEEFAKAHGCSATEKEIKVFIESKIQSGKELSDEELDQVAGGGKTVERVELKCNKCGSVFNEPDYNSWCRKKHCEYKPETNCDGILMEKIHFKRDLK